MICENVSAMELSSTEPIKLPERRYYRQVKDSRGTVTVWKL